MATLRADLEQRLQAAAGVLHKEIDHRTAALRIDLDRATLRQDRLNRRVAALGSAPIQAPVGPRIEKDGGSPPEDGIDYAALEDRFRGSEAEIKDRQRRYLKYFHGREPVLDIGCGRGEFLELLCEAGIAASGVDADHDMVLLCREKGLEVVNEDAFQRVAAIPDGSLGGVFCAQFIEHFRPETISRLTRLCYDKLRPGGTLIFETINVACVSVFARSFYLDPTHVWPFHPELTRFLLEAAGFRDISLEYLSLFHPEVRIPHLGVRLAGEEAEIFNASADVINELLFGQQDYAIIGIKRSAEIAEG
jgi:SAM-dependent methyltransferase